MNISDYLNYLYENNSQNDLSKYFVNYIAENHPNEYNQFINPIKENKDLVVNDLVKINNPIISSPKSNIKAPKVDIVNDTTIPINDNTDNITAKSVTTSNIKNEKEFLEIIKPIAERIGKKYNIDPNIIISQAAFESGWGKNTLTNKANNLFSITKGNWKGDIYSHRDLNQQGQVKEGVKFRKYKSLEESIEDWADLMNRKYSKSLVAAKISPEEFFKVHSWSGYAEGVGKTKQEAKQGIYNGYKSRYNQVLNLRKKYNI